jgi:dual specificity phosphatase 12
MAELSTSQTSRGGDPPPTGNNNNVCRILVLGSHRVRLEKAFSLLWELQQQQHQQQQQQEDCALEDQASSNDADGPRIEFLAAVATFDSYRDDSSGQTVRYLIRIDYFPSLREGKLAKVPQSLVPFLDEVAPSDRGDSFYGITSAVVGSGLNGPDDGAKVQKVLATLCPLRTVPVACLEPGPEFASMLDEFAAYRALDTERKAEVTRRGTMGPAKVAKFAMDTALEFIRNVRRAQEQEEQKTKEVAAVAAAAVEETATQAVPADPNKKRYSCKKCRTILFGQDELEDPPHLPARHDFSPRQCGNYGGARLCQSLFLRAVPSWAGDDAEGRGSNNNNEGKLSCPQCGTKVGHWNWAGAQCSCGTWVCPAIQVPASRVDEVVPHRPTLPTGTVVSPFLANLMQQQQQQG